MKSSALSLSALMTGYRSLKSAAKSVLVSDSTCDATPANVRSAVNASTMLVAVVVEHLQRVGQRVQRAAQAVLALARGSPAKRFRPSAAAMMSSVCRSSERGQLGQPRDQVGEAAGPAGDRGVGLVGDVLQRTEIALVDHDAERRTAPPRWSDSGRCWPSGMFEPSRQLALPGLVDRCGQLDVLGTQQRRLRHRRRRVLRAGRRRRPATASPRRRTCRPGAARPRCPTRCRR